MAVQGEGFLRLRVCRGSECHAVFFLCSHCDRGHRYCSLHCRQQARLRQRRCANRRYQQSPEGRLDHCDRQRRYRERRAQARVTGHSSLSIICSALSAGGPSKSTSSKVPDRSRIAALPYWPQARPVRWPCCRICGRPGLLLEGWLGISRRR